MSQDTEQEYDKNLAAMLADEDFMAWLKEFDPNWQYEYSGHNFALHLAWQGGKASQLEKDKARLDWLERGHAVVAVVSGEKRNQTVFSANFHEQCWEEYPTAREAIDAAMRGETSTALHPKTTEGAER